MFQYKSMDGKRLANPIYLPDMLTDLLGYEAPDGLVGIDTDTGLVKVQLNTEKQAYMKLGKLMHKVGKDGKTCRDYSSKLKAIVLAMKGAELSFTTNGDEAYEVYAEGPRSCMSDMDCTRAYASDNVSVAYVKIEGRVVARTVVCTDEDICLQYMRIYGNADLMLPLLKKAGYTEGSLSGCALSRVLDEQGMVMCPYLDCGTSVDDTGDYLEVTQYGEYSSQETSGILGGGERCDECQDIVSSDDTRYDEHNDRGLCECCYDDCHVIVNGESYHQDSDAIQLTGDEDYIMASEATYVESQDEYYHQDDCVYSGYSGEDYRTADTVTAITNLDYPDREICCQDDCIQIDGQWVHDDIAEKYELSLDTQEEMEI